MSDSVTGVLLVLCVAAGGVLSYLAMIKRELVAIRKLLEKGRLDPPTPTKE